jgi:hypothetical protein
MLLCLVFLNIQPAFSDTYSNNGFSITYPGGWKYQEQPSTDANTLLEVLFSNNIQAPNVNLFVELKNTHRHTLDDQTYLSELSAENKNSCDTFKSNGNSCYYSGLDESKTLVINGMKAYQIRFSWYGIDSKTVTHPNTSIVTEIPSGTNTWVIEASTAQVYYSAYVSMIQSTMQSFSLTSQTQNPIANNPSSPQVPSPDNSLLQDTLTVSTDKSSYTDGDTIIVSGQVGQYVTGFPAIIRIQTPNGNLLSTKQVDVSSGGQYSTIFAQYGVKNLSAQTTFDFKKSIPLPPGQSPPTTEQPQTPPSQTPQESNSETQMKIDLLGNNLFIIIGAIIAAIVGIVIYFIKKKTSEPRFEEVSKRSLELQGKTANLEMGIEHRDGVYVLTINLENRDMQLMEGIVDAIGKYGFDNPSFNDQRHESFKSSRYANKKEANSLFEDICYDLEKRITPTTDPGSGKGPIHESTINTEPLKVDPKNKKENIVNPIDKIVTTTTLSSLPNPSRQNQRITFTATISPRTATGTVTFGIDGTAQQPVTISNGIATFTISPLSVGTHTITAEYSGDTRYTRSVSDKKIQIVNQPPPPEPIINNGLEWAYWILGLSRTCSCGELKARHRELITKPENSLTNMLNMSKEEITRRTNIQSDINRAREMIRDEKNCPK